MSDETKIVRIKQIAERVGVSQGTVSLVLNGRGDEMRIAKDTQKRIKETANEMGYRPNIYARRLRQGTKESQNAVISIFSPTKYENVILGRTFKGLFQKIKEKDINIEIVLQPYEYDYLEEKKDIIKKNRFSGAIIIGVSENDKRFLIENDFDIPIVVFNRVTEKYSSVHIDDYEAGRKAASLFHARGHKKIGLMLYENLSKSSSLRKTGFIDTCNSYGLEISDEHIISSKIDYEDSYKATMNMLDKSKELPTAFFIIIDEIINGFLLAFHKKGIAIPDMVEVVTYGDNLIETYTIPSLTTIRMPVEDMIGECLDLLMQMINTKSFIARSIVYSTSYVFRESCGGFPE